MMKKSILFYTAIILFTLKTYSQQAWEQKYAPLLTKFNYINKIGGRVFICAGENMGNNDYGYYSDDNGSSWNKIQELNATFAIVNMSGILFACSHDTLYRSDDNGSTWVQWGSKIPANVQYLKEDNGRLYAAYWMNFYMSSDTGQTWQNLQPQGCYTMGKFAVENGHIFVYFGCGHTFLHSSDYGQTFDTLLVTPFDFSFESDLQMKNSVLYASSQFGFFVSHDLGASWTKEQSGLTGIDTLIGKITIRDSTIYITTMFGKVFRSNTNNIHWVQVGSETFPYYTPLFFDTGSEYFVGGNCGFYRSVDNAVTWTLHNTGIEPNSTPTAMLEHGGILWAGSDYGVAVTQDAGDSWSKVLAPGEVIYATNDTIMTGESSGIIELSFDNGATWQWSSPIGTYHNVLSINKIGNTWYLGMDNGLYTSTDDAVTWTLQDIDPQLAHEATYAIYKDITGTIFLSMFSKAYRSTDYGVSWQLIPSLNTLMLDAGFLRDGAVLYFWSRYGKVFRSFDDGLTWNSISNGLPGNNVRQLVKYNAAFYILAGSDPWGGWVSKGIYKLSGTTWVPFDTTMQNITMLSSAANELFIGIRDKGLYKLVSSQNSVNSHPDEISDFTVYPNPATGYFSLLFAGDNAKTRRVSLYNILGERIFLHLANIRELAINASAYPAGIYFVEVFEEQKRIVKRIVLN